MISTSGTTKTWWDSVHERSTFLDRERGGAVLRAKEFLGLGELSKKNSDTSVEESLDLGRGNNIGVF